MTTINSNITFDNETGKITKCVLEIDGNNYTVTLEKGKYNVEKGGIVAPSATSSSGAAASSSSSGAAASSSSSGAAAGSSTEMKKQPAAGAGDNNNYNDQKELIRKLGQRNYVAPTKQVI